MSVIAKMKMTGLPRAFGPTQLIELQCVCADELMPGCGDGSHKVNENLTFQQASPNGDAKFSIGADVPFARDEEFYLIFHRVPTAPVFNGAMAVIDARCNSITDYGGVSKYVEVTSAYRHRKDSPRHAQQIDSFNLRMNIDNPSASVQFEAGKDGYWIGIYRASEMTMQEALAFARAA